MFIIPVWEPLEVPCGPEKGREVGWQAGLVGVLNP